MPVRTVIIRHPREYLPKCSLTPAESSGKFDGWLSFYLAKENFSMDVSGHIELAVDAPILSDDDAHRPLLLLDGNWRLVTKMRRCIEGPTIRRSLPQHWTTAYPRKSADGSDPDNGLASIEALFAAQYELGFSMPELLEGYYWKEQFLAMNPHVPLDKL